MQQSWICRRSFLESIQQLLPKFDWYIGAIHESLRPTEQDIGPDCIVLENTANYVDPEEKKQKTCEVFSTLSTTISNPWRLGIRGLQGHSDHVWDQSCSLSNSNDDVSFVECKEEDIKEWSWILKSARAPMGRCSSHFGRYAKISEPGGNVVEDLLVPGFPSAPSQICACVSIAHCRRVL